jgi:outer membrane immunogenic protein
MKNQMKKLLLTCAALSALAGACTTAAVAADMPPSMPPPRSAVLVPFFSWNGAYIGINAGYGFGRSSWSDNVAGTTTGNFTTSGALIGGTLGYNVQTQSLVFGIETDLGWSNMKGSTSTNCLGNCTTSNTWLGTARGRIGYAFDRFLPYLTGGLAYGSLKISNDFGASATTSRVGWTVGGGLEYAFLNNWSAKLEYLYADLGKATCDAPCSGGNPFNVKFSTHLIRGGVNYKF